MLILCYLVILVIMVLSYIQFIHVIMLFLVFMLKVTGLTRLMSDLVCFRLFSFVPSPPQVHREEMLPLSSVFFPSSKIVDVLLWTLSSTAMACSRFIGEYHCYFYASFIVGSFESRQNFYVLFLSMIETIIVKA